MCVHNDTMRRLEAAAGRLPAVAAFAGHTAAWLHGIDVDVRGPIEAIVPKGNRVSARSGMKIYRSRLPEDEVVVIDGLRTTNALRTLEDIGRRSSLVEGTVILDAAFHDGVADLAAFQRRVKSLRGGRGLVNLRHATALAEPKSESPMETRLRMILVLAGLPRPEAQVSIFDSRGRLIGRPDLYYAERRLGLEYDGATHRANLVDDNRRQNLLLEAGVTLLRFTSSDVLTRPAIVAAQVRAVCSSAGTRARNTPVFMASAGTRT